MLDQYFQNTMWQLEYFSNTLQDYLYAVIAFVILLILLKIIQVVILKRLEVLVKRTETDLDDTAIEIINSIKPSISLYIAGYLAFFLLEVSGGFQRVLDFLLLVAIVYQVVITIQILIDFFVSKNIDNGEAKISKSGIKTLSNISKWILWLIGILLILSNLGVNITSLIAGLGIGGLAIALALQNVLTDLFSSFSIYFDKPFIVGDFITVGKNKGTVEKIGIKTTRIKSLQGEELIISNRELTNATIQNFGKLKERRVSMEFGVTYDTSNKKLELIPEIAKKIINSIDLLRFDRAHFKSFGDSALTYELVYYAETSEYAKYMDSQQSFNLQFKTAMEKEGIDFAYPTQTVHVVN